MSDTARTPRRLHIGNISPKLAENSLSLATRLNRFGTLTKPLEFHTKPVGDYYFAFADIEISDKDFEKLRAALNGVVFMGRKLTVALSKPLFQEATAKDRRRPDVPKRVLRKHEGIAEVREQRIRESQATTPQNTITGAPLVKTAIAANKNSMGYMKSAHTYKDMSGNTKNKSPSHSLIGAKSYGATLIPRGPFSQQYSRKSGFGEIVKGRLRKSPRPTAYFVRKQQTLRILINGELKQFKSYKTKLWGLENATAMDLTYRYHNGAWRSGADHIVERVISKNASASNDAVQPSHIEEKASEDKQDTNTESLSEDETIYKQEQSKNASVLAKLFNSYDFDKPVEVGADVSDEEEVTYDSKGRKSAKRYDYEAQGVVAFASDDSDDEDIGAAESNIQSFMASHERPKEQECFSEDDEGNELDVDGWAQNLSTEATKNKYDEEHGIEVETEKAVSPEVIEPEEKSATPEEAEEVNGKESDEEDLMPTFGGGEPSSITETLRSLFNQTAKAEESSSFKFDLSDDDIDEQEQLAAEEERQKLLEQIKRRQQEQQTATGEVVGSVRKYGLFWSHFESPFLQTQTQLSKIGYVGEAIKLPGEDDDTTTKDAAKDGEEDDYEKWFWSVRGEIGRECKRRKRDVMRIMKKRTTKAVI